LGEFEGTKLERPKQGRHKTPSLRILEEMDGF
jgi:hypothetical protein